MVITHYIETLTRWINYPILTLGNNSISLGHILSACIVLYIGFRIAVLCKKTIITAGAKRQDIDQSSFYTLSRFASYVIYCITFFIAVSILGIDTSQVTVVIGALSVGIGFGLQTIFNNFISGILLLVEKTLKVGDFVELDSGLFGTVKEINIRSTIINTPDNMDIIVPNSEFINGHVINWTYQDVTRRIHIPFGVAYGSDKEKVRTAVCEAALRLPFTLKGGDRDPDVWLVNFGESSLDFELIAWIDPRLNKKPGALKAAFLWEIETALHNAGIEIPFPQRDLHIKTDATKPPFTDSQ